MPYADKVTQYLSSLISAGKKQIILDLGQVDFISSAGLRAILIALKESRKQGGDLHLACAQPGVQSVLELSGFTSIVKTFATVDAASLKSCSTMCAIRAHNWMIQRHWQN